MKIALKIIIGFVFVVGLFIYWFVSKITDTFSPTYKRVELVSADNQKLYIKSMNWGLTGDSQLTVITTDDEREFQIDSARQIIFDGLEPFLYRTSNDTLFLTVRQTSKVPKNFNTCWTIIQKWVDHSTMEGRRHDPEQKGI
jgi:hypothetical protein